VFNKLKEVSLYKIGQITAMQLMSSSSNVTRETGYDTIRYDTIEEINVDSKAEYTA